MTSDRFASLSALAGSVSRETYGRLEEFENVFLRWAKRINLAAPSTLEDVWHRHILDSAQLASIPSFHLARTWVDIGSGGGFPGAVIAILAEERRELSVCLVEANGKKAAFLRAALAELSPSARIANTRAEAFIAQNSAPDVVSARAVTSLDSLVGLCEPWLARHTVGFFHKGREYRQELKLAHDTWILDLVEHESAVDSESVILEVRNARRRL